LEALSSLGFGIPIAEEDAKALVGKIGTNISTNADVIAVSLFSIRSHKDLA
jgi:hypothetical protein